MTQGGLLLELGEVPYGEAWELQRRLVARRRAGEIPDTLLLLSHRPCYTIGRSGSRQHVLRDDVEVVESDRGGDATYHGPGQVVGYPILDLRARSGDVHRYLRDVEELLLRTLAELGLTGERDDRFTGVWIGGAKVAAIGVKVSGGISSHGFALNVDTDPAHWAGIVPCGLDRPVTTLRELLGEAPAEARVRRLLANHAGAVFGLSWRRSQLDELAA